MTIHLGSPALDFAGDEAATQKFAFLGRSGSGKSYAFGVLVEGLVKEKQQVIIVDPVGVHYGLRLGADGKSEGLSIPVFGGLHGDVALLPSSGQIVADLLVTRGTSAVIDVSEFSPEEQARFVAGFFDLFFHMKKKHPSPVHIGLEEAHEFAPEQTSSHLEQKMRASIIRVAKLGRNYGIGLSIISQRPQDISKKVLNQTECLLAFQTSGSHERKAIAGWVTGYVGDVPITEKIPTLPVGNAVAYSPQWLRVTKEVKIAAKRTYDSSSTPKHGNTHAEPKPLTTADLAALKEAMSVVEEQAKENDPTALRSEVRRLRAALEEHADDGNRFAMRMAVIAAELGLAPDAPIAAMKAAIQGLKARSDNDPEKNKMKDALQSITGLLRVVADGATNALEYAEPLAFPHTPILVTEPKVASTVVAKATFVSAKTLAARVMTANADDVTAYDALRKGAREMFKAIAGRYPQSLTREQCATLAGLTHTSGTFGAYLSDLKKANLIMLDEANYDGTLMLSDQGLDVCALRNIPTSVAVDSRALLALWLPKFRAGARRMLEQVVHHPTGIKRTALAKSVDIEETSGTFGAYLSDLKRNSLIIVQRDGTVLPSPELVR